MPPHWPWLFLAAFVSRLLHNCEQTFVATVSSNSFCAIASSCAKSTFWAKTDLGHSRMLPLNEILGWLGSWKTYLSDCKTEAALNHVETHFVNIHLSWTSSRSGRSDRGTRWLQFLRDILARGGARLIALFWHEIIAIWPRFSLIRVIFLRTCGPAPFDGTT